MFRADPKLAAWLLSTLIRACFYRGSIVHGYSTPSFMPRLYCAGMSFPKQKAAVVDLFFCQGCPDDDLRSSAVALAAFREHADATNDIFHVAAQALATTAASAQHLLGHSRYRGDELSNVSYGIGIRTSCGVPVLSTVCRGIRFILLIEPTHCLSYLKAFGKPARML